MLRLTGSFFYLIAGTLAGAISAYAYAQHAGVLQLGTQSPWQSRTAGLEGSSGLYVQSHYLLAGRLPLAQGQFFEASAETDSEGTPLSASCSYEIVSTAELPRWWAVSATTAGAANPSQQASIDSAVAVREFNGPFRITASATPQPGNWLKLQVGLRFVLQYAASPAGGGAAAPPFTITRKDC